MTFTATNNHPHLQLVLQQGTHNDSDQLPAASGATMHNKPCMTMAADGHSSIVFRVVM